MAKTIQELQMKLNELKDKRVLILGFGREGMDTLRFLRRLFPKKVLAVADRLEFKKLDIRARKLIHHEKRSRGIKLYLGKDYFKTLKNYDVIIKSPGVPPKVITPFLTKRQRVTSQTEIFFDNCPGKIIGVTGTKGKGTTCSLIYRILKEGGLKAQLVGNIGKPVLNLLIGATPKDVYVYEISSHQLYNLKQSPHIAVLLNISQAHLDYFKSFDQYVRAKANITKYQIKDDFLIYNSQDEIVRSIAKKSKAKKIPIPMNYRVRLRLVKSRRIGEFIISPPFFSNSYKRSKKRENIRKGGGIRIPLIGGFNLQNIMAAVAVGKIFGISDKNIAKAIKNFKSLPHRLEYVGKFRGIKFYNDSASTVPESAIGAISALGKDLQTIILGGYESKVNYQTLAREILQRKIKNLIFLPPNGRRIWQTLRSLSRVKKLPKNFFVNNMKDAVKLVYRCTQRGKICLLSPAAPSFGIFRNYKERGNLFKKYVKKIAHENFSS